jgi:hypothetical protein
MVLRILFNLYVPRQQVGGQKTLNRMVPGLREIKPKLNNLTHTLQNFKHQKKIIQNSKGNEGIRKAKTNFHLSEHSFKYR